MYDIIYNFVLIRFLMAQGMRKKAAANFVVAIVRYMCYSADIVNIFENAAALFYKLIIERRGGYARYGKAAQLL